MALRNSTKAAGPKGKKTAERVRRLTPEPDVLRELYLLSGNNCAMPQCDRVIVSNQGTITGRVCHIEAAMPGGPRFNKASNNEKRRQRENLILLCSDHHALADDKKFEAAWTVAKLKKVKLEHEMKFRGIDETLMQSFESGFVDVTDKLAPTTAKTFDAFNLAVTDCALTGDYVGKASKQIASYIEKMRVVPDRERQFMLSIIRRAIKRKFEYISVPAHEVTQALGVSKNKLSELSDSLERYGVGGLWEVGIGDKDVFCVHVTDPSKYLGWIEIEQFCQAKPTTLENFVINLKFGILD